MDDALSNIFEMLRLKSCVYFQRDFYAPWGMSMTKGTHAQFHLVVRGKCVVEVNEGTYYVNTGDVLLFPRGMAHNLLDQTGSTCLKGQEVLTSFETSKPAFSEGTDSVRLICGHFEYRDTPPVLLIDQLPDFIHINAFDIFSQGAAESIVPLLIRECDSKKAGSSTIVEHLAGILLIQTLREYIRTTPQPSGLLAGLSDFQLGRALKLIHAHPDWSLSVERLASEAGMSRSMFSDKFKAVVGLTPNEYLIKLRILTASDLLIEQKFAIPQIAEKVGYTSEVAFARAFKREMGDTPSAYRRKQT